MTIQEKQNLESDEKAKALQETEQIPVVPQEEAQKQSQQENPSHQSKTWWRNWGVELERKVSGLLLTFRKVQADSGQSTQQQSAGQKNPESDPERIERQLGEIQISITQTPPNEINIRRMEEETRRMRILVRELKEARLREINARYAGTGRVGRKLRKWVIGTTLALAAGCGGLGLVNIGQPQKAPTDGPPTATQSGEGWFNIGDLWGQSTKGREGVTVPLEVHDFAEGPYGFPVDLSAVPDSESIKPQIILSVVPKDASSHQEMTKIQLEISVTGGKRQEDIPRILEGIPSILNVVAPMHGRIVEIHPSHSDWGPYVTIENGWGFRVYLSRLNSVAGLKEGDMVYAGEAIGTIKGELSESETIRYEFILLYYPGFDNKGLQRQNYIEFASEVEGSRNRQTYRITEEINWPAVRNRRPKG